MTIRDKIPSLLALVLLLAACGTDTPTARTTDSPSATATASPSPDSGDTLVVYVSYSEHLQTSPGSTDVWLYDTGTDDARALTTDGDATQESAPVFRDADHVTYMVIGDEERRSVFEVELSSGDRELLFDTDGHLWSLDWDPQGRELAMIQNIEGSKAVRLYSRETGQTRTIFELPVNLGRGGVATDEIAATWSPDGRYLSIVDTAGERGSGEREEEPPISVIDRSGKVVLDGISGTFARWSSDSAGIYFRPYAAGGGGGWRYAEIATRKVSAIGIDMKDAVHASVSPTGRHIAVSQDSPDASVAIADTTRDAEDPVAARNALAPIWLSANEIAVTEVEPCDPDSCGEFPTWRIAGRALLIDIRTLERKRLALHHTGPLENSSDVWSG